MKKPSIKKIQIRKKAAQPPQRITNETVAEHRERILAGGRKFKYPIQYARHKLVINTLLIVVASLAIFSGLTWWQLYKEQTSNTFFYRITMLIPLPAASVDGISVRYSDYLMGYRSSEYYLRQYDQIDPSSADGKRQLDYVKRKTMDNAILAAYAGHVAVLRGISVTSGDIDQIINRDKETQNGTVSQEAYDASAMRYLNWSRDEYRHDAEQRLLVQKVSFAVDDTANNFQQKIAQILAQTPTIAMQDTIKQLAVTGDSAPRYGVSGLTSVTGATSNLPSEAQKLTKGQVSGVIKSSMGDGYYFIRLLEKNDSQVNYEFIQVPLTQLKATVLHLRQQGKIKEYITVPALEDHTSAPTN